jgi:hypothetical protein
MKPWPLLAIALLATGCNHDDDDFVPPDRNALVVSPNFEFANGTVVVPDAYPYIIPGGVLIPRGSNVLTLDIWMRIQQPARRAQLNIYLMTGPGGSDYCGQNSPDMPLWTDRPAGWATRYTVTGFRVYTLPCEVTGIRTILHSREDNGLLIPPTAAQSIIDTRTFARFVIRRE